MRSSIRWCGALAVCVLLAVAAPSLAKKTRTPDGMTPAEELVCQPVKDSGKKNFGLCNAYCEAQDCDEHPGNGKSCSKLLKNWEKQTGLTEFPCDCTADQIFDPTAGCVCAPEVVRECDAVGGVLDPETCECACPEPQVLDPLLGCTCDTGRIAECEALGGELNERCECVVELCGDVTSTLCQDGACPRDEICTLLSDGCECLPDIQEPVCGFDPQSQQCGGACPAGQICIPGTAAAPCSCQDEIPPPN